jgi:ribosomal protein S27E
MAYKCLHCGGIAIYLSIWNGTTNLSCMYCGETADARKGIAKLKNGSFERINIGLRRKKSDGGNYG